MYGRSDPRSTYSIAMYGVPVVLEVVVDGDDVRVAQRAGHARLAQEALRERGIGRVERPELLERDEAVQVGLAGEVDQGHAAAADLAEDLVAPDRLQSPRAPGPAFRALNVDPSPSRPETQRRPQRLKCLSLRDGRP